MNAQQLRNSILQEAIEGRLVPQNPNDEPASVLLQQIREEKKRLVKEGKLKKKDLEEKPISEDEIPFEIPESWEWVRLSQLFNFIDYRGSTPTKLDSGIPLVTAKNVKRGYNDYSIKDYISAEEYESRKSRGISKRGDLLFTTEAPLGNVSVADLDVFSAGQRLITLQSYSCNNTLIMFFMLSDSFQKSLIEKKTGTTVAGIKASKLKDILIPLPPLAEQHRIVAKIEELMPKVEEYGKAQEAFDKLNAELPEKLKKSILQEAIEGRLVPQDPNDEPASVLLDKIRKEKARLVKEGKLKKKDLVETPISEDEKPFEIPESWEWCRLGDVIEFINGRAYKRDELLDRGKYKVLRVGNFFTNDSWYYSDMELPDEKYCYPGDLLYAWSASFGPKIWKGEKTIFHYHIWNVKFSPIILWREYLYYFFLADKSRIKQSTTGSTMIHVSMENMKPRLIPLPPLAEQKRIVEKIEQLMGEIDKLKA